MTTKTKEKSKSKKSTKWVIPETRKEKAPKPKSNKKSAPKTTKEKAPKQRIEDAVKKTTTKPRKLRLEDLHDDCAYCKKEKHLNQLYTLGCYWHDEHQNKPWLLICEDCLNKSSLKNLNDEKKWEILTADYEIIYYKKKLIECFEDVYLNIYYLKDKKENTMRSINMAIGKENSHLKQMELPVDEASLHRQRMYGWY